MKVAGAWLEAAETQALLHALRSKGHQALFVGGCVRNAILGVPVQDVDIATDATPDVVIRIAENAGLRAVPTGIDHGTVTVISGGLSHEVTTFRRDVQTDGRHAVVTYSTSVAEDAARRDFTMNAIYAQADGEVIDPLSGMADLVARRVRFVGDADQRIAEDHLRILRFFRFHAMYGDPDQGIDPEGLAASAANCAAIDTLSRERVGAEMQKLLSAFDPSPAVSAMDHAGVLARVSQGASARALPVLVHLEQGNSRGWLCRLAVLGGQNILDRLRLSRANASTLDQMRAEIASGLAPDALGWRYGEKQAGDIVHARAALLETALPDLWQADAHRGAAAVFPVAAVDLMPALQGPALGARLKSLQGRWLASGLMLTREQLLA